MMRATLSTAGAQIRPGGWCFTPADVIAPLDSDNASSANAKSDAD